MNTKKANQKTHEKRSDMNQRLELISKIPQNIDLDISLKLQLGTNVIRMTIDAGLYEKS